MSGISPSSNYWRISHQDDDSSAFHIPSTTAFSKEGETIAVSSSLPTENLKIFQLAEASLVHLASITLPDVQSLRFLKPITPPPHDFKFLVTGHSSGIAHLSAVPLADNSVFENAEIIKRFNHRKHLKSSELDAARPSRLNDGTLSTTISSIQLTESSWRSTPLNSMVSVYDHHLFVWDTSRSRAPLSVIRTNGVSGVVLNNKVDSLAAIIGGFGLSLLDLRTGKNQSKTSLYLPPTPCSVTPSSSASSSSSSSSIKYGSSKGFTCAEWCQTKENYIATVQNDIVYIWDIRKLEPLTQLTGFSDSVSHIKWSGDNLWTADQDGFLINWDLGNIQELQNKQCLVSNQSNLADLWDSFHIDDKPGKKVFRGKATKVSNSKIISMDLDTSRNSLICLDNSYLSTHGIEKLTKNSKPTGMATKRSKKPAPIYVGPERIVSTESFVSSDCAPLFDSGTCSRKTSDNTSFPPSPASDLKKFSSSRDYLEYFQKEIDMMLESMDTKKINDTVYI